VHLIESDTRPHRIPKQRRRGKSRVIAIPGVGVRAYAQHPGTKGKHPWRKGTAKALPKVPAVIAGEVRSAMAAKFGG
jgi:hypothetical protein